MKTVYTKPIFDIFSKTKVKEKVEEKQKVIVDYREKNSLVASELISLGIEVEFRELKVADYLVNDIAIERKTISDFIGSMLNKRIFRQLEEIQQYEKKFLIIEGFEEQELYNDDRTEGVSANAIRGFLLSIILKYKIPIIFSKDSEDTAKFINVLARKKVKESSLNVSKKNLNKKERMQFILESFPGIGPKNAKKLLEEFKTIKNIMNSPLEEIEKVVGKKAEVFKIVEEDY